MPEQQAATYLRGLELFNSQHYWDAHEQWEQLWLAAGRSGPAADFLKGLIKLAAAGVKHLAGQPAGTHSHAVRGTELFRSVAAALGDSYLGLSLPPLIALAETIAKEGWPTQAPVLSLASGADLRASFPLHVEKNAIAIKPTDCRPWGLPPSM